MKEYTPGLKGKTYLGFTLIELLIVIMIIGLLAFVILNFLNPQENMARSRDAGRISAVTQLGGAVNAYYLSNNSTFPSIADWDTELASSGHPQNFPAGIKYIIAGSLACQTNVRPLSTPSYCYDAEVSVNNAIVYSILESQNQKSKCVGSGSPYFVYSTADGRGGIVCAVADPTPWTRGSMTYIN